MYIFLFACRVVSEPVPAPVPEPDPVLLAASTSEAQSCQAAKNVCPDYAPSWVATCPSGSRCVTFQNSCASTVGLAYNIGCNGDGTSGAPQCACTGGPVLASGASVSWIIVDGNYTSCLPSWQPACLTASLAVIANPNISDCSKGSRIEFSAGNSSDPYGRFDSYNLDIEKAWYAVPVRFKPNLPRDCAKDSANHDCRPLWCDSDTCPDAYATPTAGGCPDGRSPQAGCQDTFSDPAGYTVEFCPSSGSSCQDATACP